MEKYIKNQEQEIVENFREQESPELKEKVNCFKEKSCFYGYASTPAGEQLIYEILKIVRKNNLSITDADSVLDAVQKVIKYTSLNQPLHL